MIWTTADGAKIQVVRMSDNHLLNARRFMYGRRDKLRKKILQNGRRFIKHGPRTTNTLTDWIDVLDGEIKKRGLNDIKKKSKVPTGNDYNKEKGNTNDLHAS